MPLHVAAPPASTAAENPAAAFQTVLPPALPMMTPISPMYADAPPPLLDPLLPPELPPEELLEEPPEELPPLLPPEELPPPLLLPELLPPELPPELLLPVEEPPTGPPFEFEDDALHPPSEA